MLDEKLLLELQDYVDTHSRQFKFAICESPIIVESDFCESIQHNELENFIKSTRKPTFSQVLFSLIDKKGASDSDSRGLRIIK